jgi:hypothetical protein
MNTTGKANVDSENCSPTFLASILEKAMSFKKRATNRLKYLIHPGKMRWEVLTGLIPPNSQGAEIGSAEGNTASYILTHRKDVKLYSIDPYFTSPDYEDEFYARKENREADDWKSLDWCEKESDRKLAPFIAEGRCVRIKKTSREAVGMFGEGSLDFVFIDGNHSYEYVREDIASWYPIIKRNGLFSGHDYGNDDFPDVKRAVDEFGRSKGLRVKVYDNCVWSLIPD